MATQYNDNDIFADNVGYDSRQGDNEAWYDNARLLYDANDVATIPNLFDVTDLIAIEAWQAPVTEQTDVSLLPNDVFLWGDGLGWCCVFNGRLIAKDLRCGDAFVVYAKAVAEAARALPFQGEYSLAVMESEK